MGDEEKAENPENVEEKIHGSEEHLCRRYMNLFIKREEQLEAMDRLHLRQAPELPDLPDVGLEDEVPAQGYPINLFNRSEKIKLPNRLRREENVEVWSKMKDNPSGEVACFNPEPVTIVSKTNNGNWPDVCPCVNLGFQFDPSKKFRKFGEHCTKLESADTGIGESKDDFANRIELWHARVPMTCPSVKSNAPMIDRAIGYNHSLVSGDYILTETVSKKKRNRIYANICLRGLTGMHLPELDRLRAREKTWKWCFYQAIVALLVKTQLRYKHIWSGNIDYIYERGWNLFTHIGNINVNQIKKQRFDDIAVYNYTYNVEVELIQEIKDIPRITNVRWDFVEPNNSSTKEIVRKDLMKVKSKMGVEKSKDEETVPVYKATREIEKWFDKLSVQYQNCIFRTTRYCLAFWKEGSFWYLYNPYRCDDFGFWDDTGYACIVKFCSRNALKRHLMVLLLRAYVYEMPQSKCKNFEKVVEEEGATDEGTNTVLRDVFTVQIFELLYNKCELINLKLLQRRIPKPMMCPVWDKTLEVCPYDPMNALDSCTGRNERIQIIENPEWLKWFKVTWQRSHSSSKKLVKESIMTGKLRWHQFYVEEAYELFSLWGEIHPTQALFPVEHRGKQAFACYVVCAGMTRITAPEYWSPKTLNAIVMCGDKYYTISILEAGLKLKRPEYAGVKNWDRYLAKSFKIGETIFEGTLLPGIAGRLYVESANSLWGTLQDMFLEHPFGIVTCESTSVGVFKFCGAYYMCDVCSTGPPLFQYGGGVIYLIRTTYFMKFMTVLILTIASTECSEFEVNPIEICNAVDVGSPTCLAGVGKKNRPHNLIHELGKLSCRHESDNPNTSGKNLRSEYPKKNKAVYKDQESPCKAAGYVKPLRTQKVSTEF